jgi:hypothetical protein
MPCYQNKTWKRQEKARFCREIPHKLRFAFFFFFMLENFASLAKIQHLMVRFH